MQVRGTLAVVLLMLDYNISLVARWIQCQSDRSSLQSATFHTLRTYLTPLRKQIRKWRLSPFSEATPEVVQEAQKWLKQDRKDSG